MAPLDAAMVAEKMKKANHPETLARNRVEKTMNNFGYMYLDMGESADYWLRSLPHSKKPLLDLGCAFGVHTLHAIKNGRDVIAVDCHDNHIQILTERAEKLLEQATRDDTSKYGNLVRTVVETLPAGHLFPPASASGILLTEVMHFFALGQPTAFFKDAFTWLEPGGLLVVTTKSATSVESFLEYPLFYHLQEGYTMEQMKECVETKDGKDLVEIAPYFLKLPSDSLFRKHLCERLYVLTEKELSAMAVAAGFEIVRIDLVSKAYNRSHPSPNNTVLVVVRKPIEGP